MHGRTNGTRGGSPEQTQPCGYLFLKVSSRLTTTSHLRVSVEVGLATGARDGTLQWTCEAERLSRPRPSCIVSCAYGPVQWWNARHGIDEACERKCGVPPNQAFLNFVRQRGHLLLDASLRRKATPFLLVSGLCSAYDGHWGDQGGRTPSIYPYFLHEGSISGVRWLSC